jgi:ATP-dependent protease ClpP protease subunit
MTGQVYPLKCRIRNEDAGTTRIDVFDDIGGGGWFDEGVTAKSFAAQMAKVKGPLDVHINSGGGEVHDGVAIGNAIRNHKGFKRTVVDGIAASIASVIFQAGDERVVEPGAMVMIHDASTLCWGDEAEMQKTAEVLGKNSDNIAQIYADRAGGTRTCQPRQRVDQPTGLAAIDMGVIHEGVVLSFAGCHGLRLLRPCCGRQFVGRNIAANSRA